MCSSFWGPTCSWPSGTWGPAGPAFLVLGYLISWAAEFASIHWGFPFGEYLYIPATVDRELWGGRGALHGFPVLCLSGLCQLFPGVAGVDPGRWEGRRFSLEPEAALKGSWRPVILGAVLMVTLDIVIDPLALRGYRWFLGQIYGYPESGVYFGIPLSNFGGWFLVSLGLIGVLQLIITRAPASPRWDWGRRRFAFQALLGPGLYLGILGFNLTMTFLIGETCLGWVGIFIYLPFLSWLALNLAPGSQQ